MTHDHPDRRQADSPAQEEEHVLHQEALSHMWMQTRHWNELSQPGGLLILTRGEGVRLYDIDGREYFDASSGLWVVNAGHGRREIADAAYAQLTSLHYVNTFAYASRPPILLARKLAEITPGDLSHVFFANSGSEAVETALKIARQYHYLNGSPGRYKFIYRRESYHGQTFGAMMVNGARPVVRKFFEPLPPGGIHVPNVNCYRCPYEMSYPSCDVFCARAIASAIEFERPESVAAVIAEPISLSAGVHIPPKEYWQILRETCDRFGVLLIADEVINGFGRTGKWFACEHFDLVPDIMTMAKGMSSGYVPISGTIAASKIFDRFKGDQQVTFSHGFTFGSHPVAAATALKNLEIMEREHLVENAAEMGRYLLDALETLRSHPTVGDVRGVGLLTVVELVRDKKTKARFPESDNLGYRMPQKLAQRGVLTRASDIINIAPPLCVTRQDIDQIVTAVDEAIDELERELL